MGAAAAPHGARFRSGMIAVELQSRTSEAFRSPTQILELVVVPVLTNISSADVLASSQVRDSACRPAGPPGVAALSKARARRARNARMPSATAPRPPPLPRRGARPQVLDTFHLDRPHTMGIHGFSLERTYQLSGPGLRVTPVNVGLWLHKSATSEPPGARGYTLFMWSCPSLCLCMFGWEDLKLTSCCGPPPRRMLQDADEYRSWALLGFLACPPALAGHGARGALAGLLSEGLLLHVYEDVTEPLHPLFEEHVRPGLERLTEASRAAAGAAGSGGDGGSPRRAATCGVCELRDAAGRPCSMLFAFFFCWRPSAFSRTATAAHTHRRRQVIRDHGADRTARDGEKAAAKALVEDAWRAAAAGAAREHALRRLYICRMLQDLADELEVGAFWSV